MWSGDSQAHQTRALHRAVFLGFLFALAIVPLAVVGCASSSGSGSEEEPEPEPVTRLVGADSDGTIYTIDPDTGDTTELGESGVSGIDSMAQDPQSGSIFAGIGFSEMYMLSDVDITAAADQLSAVAFTLDDQGGSADLSGGYTGMAGHPTDGSVYVVNESECTTMFSFDPATGVATLAMDTGFPTCYSLNSGGLPIAIDSSGTFYLIENYNEDNEVYTLNPQGESAALVGTFTYVDFPSTPGPTDLVHTMAMRLSDDRAFVALTTGDFAEIDWSNPSDITVTYIGTLPAVLDGLAFITQ